MSLNSLANFMHPIISFSHLHMLHTKMSALQGREYRKNDASVKVDYNTSDPVVRWDSYENFNLHHQDSMESKKCTHTHTHKCKKSKNNNALL